MQNMDIVRAWKDPEYRASLSPAAASMLPENPAGRMELSGNQLRNPKDTHVTFRCGTTFVDSCVTPPQQCP